MCEITIIAVIFIVAMEFNCKELFNAKNSNQQIIKPVRRNDSGIHCGISGTNLVSDKNISILQIGEYTGKTAKEVNAINGKDL